jgi:multiple sugar transport system substrate-binding protein
MKNSVSKLMILVLSLMLCFLSVGCSNSDKISDVDSENKQLDNNKEKDNKEKIKLVFWHHYNEQSNENKTLMNIIIPKFEKENPGVKIEAVSHDWADLHNKALVAATANNLPDVMRVDSAWIPEFVDVGILQPLDQKFDDFNDVRKGLLDGPMNTAKVDGHYYGLGLNTNTKIMFYNTKLLTDNDVEMPKTLDDFFKAAEKVSQNNNGQPIWGYGEPALSGWNILPLIWSNGGEILNEDCTIATGFLDSELNIELLEKLVELYKNAYMTGFNSGDIPMTDGFAQGRYAMIFDGPWKYAELRGGHSDFTDYATTTMPKGKGGSIQVLGGEDISITSEANADYAWKFVKFMTSEFAQVEMGKVGQIPVNKTALNNEEITSIKDFTVFLEAIKSSRPRPAISDWSKVDQLINDAFTVAMIGNKSPEEALKEAAQNIDKLLEK